MKTIQFMTSKRQTENTILFRHFTNYYKTMAFFQAVTVGADIAVAFGVFYSAENYFAE